MARHPLVANKVTVEDTSANALIVGGSVDGTSGTGGIRAGTVGNTDKSTVFIGTGAQLVGFAAHGLLIGGGASGAIAVSGAGTAGQVLTSNGASLDPTFQALTVGTLLVGSASGTNTVAAATNVATFAISGLGANDTLEVILSQSGQTQSTANPVLYNVTDSIVIQTTLNANVAAFSQYFLDRYIIRADQSDPKQVRTLGSSSQDLPNNASTLVTFTTNFTGSWTLALRTGTGGVTAGGTYRYSIAVYRHLG